MKINNPYTLHEIGQRQNQEDSIFPAKSKADSNTRFFLVCDGMGGHENGEVAGQTVCESFGTFLKTVSPEDFNKAIFEQALAFAYDELDKKDNSSAFSGKMGTTLTFLHLNKQEAFLAHIGDSRIYHIRPANGSASILHKTSDHSLVNELLKAEVITPEEAETHPKKNVITRAIQPHLEKRNKADIYSTPDVKAGDYFFLCSDGILESLSDKQLIEIIAGNTADESKMQAVYQLCSASSKDNFSAYLVPVLEGVAETAETVQLAENVVSAAPDIACITAPPVVKQHKKKSNPSMIFWVLLLAIVGVGAYFLAKPLFNRNDENKKTVPEQTIKSPSTQKGAKPQEEIKNKMNNNEKPNNSQQVAPEPAPSVKSKVKNQKEKRKTVV